MEKTRYQIEALKENWLSDPCWDIEDTEGFETHKKELLDYRMKCDKNSERKKVIQELGGMIKIKMRELSTLKSARDFIMEIADDSI